MHQTKTHRQLPWKTCDNPMGSSLLSCCFVSTIGLLSVLVVVCIGCSSKPAASITAVPNPVPAGSGQGTTTITWEISDGSTGQVYLSVDGGEEKLFAGLASKGSKEVKWIGHATYDFRLYAGPNKHKLLASVPVIRQQGGRSEVPTTAPAAPNEEPPQTEPQTQ